MRKSLFSPTPEEVASALELKRSVEQFLDEELEPSTEGDATAKARPKRTRRDAVIAFCAPGFVIGDGQGR